MLGMKTYPRDYIAACRHRIEADIAAFRQHTGGRAAKELEARFFNNQVLLLDYMFVHRLAGVEGKDGNALNEVRALCNSLLLNGGRFQVERLPEWPKSAGATTRVRPDTSVLGLSAGDDVRLSEADFARLCAAFFDQIETKYTETS